MFVDQWREGEGEKVEVDEREMEERESNGGCSRILGGQHGSRVNG